MLGMGEGWCVVWMREREGGRYSNLACVFCTSCGLTCLLCLCLRRKTYGLGEKLVFDEICIFIFRCLSY